MLNRYFVRQKSPHRINRRCMKGRIIEWQSNNAFLSCRFQTMRTKVEHDKAVVNPSKPSCSKLSMRTRRPNIGSGPHWSVWARRGCGRCTARGTMLKMQREKHCKRANHLYRGKFWCHVLVAYAKGQQRLVKAKRCVVAAALWKKECLKWQKHHLLQ